MPFLSAKLYSIAFRLPCMGGCISVLLDVGIGPKMVI